MKLKALLQTTLAAVGMVATIAHAQTVVLYSSNNTETIETALDVVKKDSAQPEGATGHGRHGFADEAHPGRIQEPTRRRAMERWFRHPGCVQGPAPAVQGTGHRLAIPAQSSAARTTCGSARKPMHVMVMMVNRRQLKGNAAPKTWST